MPREQKTLAQIVREHQEDILSEWMRLQVAEPTSRRDLISDAELRDDCRTFLERFTAAVETGDTEARDSSWRPVYDFLVTLSRTRALRGFTPVETATFVFSLKQPIFQRLRDDRKEPEALALDTWKISTLLDRLGLFTTDAYQKGREEVIMRQQQELLELSTPVVTIWDGIVALPLIGTLDSARTQVVMENLLQRIVDRSASIAIIDITGVPTVDTLVAQHLLKTVAAARLMGADCIISGIRPQIAQTIVHLGVDLAAVSTKATLADALALALARTGQRIVKQAGSRGGSSPSGSSGETQWNASRS
jgi:rsbT co-antagonist protein RsbR